MIFTALITIGIFILGFWLNKKHDERKEFDSLMEVKSYFLQLIEILIKSSETQIKAFKDIAGFLKEKKDNSFNIDFSSNFTTRYIDEIPNEKLFKIFITYKPDKEKPISLFKDLVVNLGFIRHVESEWEDSYKDFNRRYWKWTEEYFQYDKQITDFIDQVLHSFQDMETLKKDEFLFQFLDIRTKWHKIPNYQDRHIREEHFINPIFQLCQRMPKDPRILELLSPIRGCIYTFSQIKRIKEDYSKLFGHYHQHLINALSTIQKNLAEIEKYEDTRPSII